MFLGCSSSSSGFVGPSFYLSLAEGGNFLCLPGGHAIVDPGASQDLIGWESYLRLQQRLNEVGLRVVELKEKPGPASGIGGSATPVVSALCPCILGGQAGIIKLSVVQEDVPQLLSIGLLEHGGAIIDTNVDKITFAKFGSEQQMTKQNTGHGTIDIAEWPGGVFPVPEQLTREHGILPGAFNQVCSDAEESYMSSAAAADQLRKSRDDVKYYSILGHDLTRSYVRETLPPPNFLGWSFDMLGNDVLISLPRLTLDYQPQHVSVDCPRSIWFCSNNRVANFEFFSSRHVSSIPSSPLSIEERASELRCFLSSHDIELEDSRDHVRIDGFS